MSPWLLMRGASPGVQAYCFVRDQTIVEVAKTINSDSSIQFKFDSSGTCWKLTVTNEASNPPKKP